MASSPQRADAVPAFGSRRRECLLVGAVVGLALALRVAHVLFSRESPFFAAPTLDGDYHHQWARAFAAGETFREGPFFRAPLYPWFLGVCLKLFGPGVLVPRLLQALLGATATWLTYLVGKRAFCAPVGLVAAVLVATSWVLIYFDGELLIPTLIVPLDLWALYLTLGLRDRPTAKQAGCAGAVWGLSAIARPNVLLFMPCLAGWLVWRARPAWRRGLVPVLALTAGTLAPILPITLTNVARGDFALISTQAGVNFWIGNNPDSDGSSAIVPGTRGGWQQGYEDAITQAEAAEGRELKPSEVSRHYSGRAWAWIGDEPGAALRHLGWKLRLFWTRAELGNNLPVEFFAGYYDPLLRWSPVGFPLLFGLGLLGLLMVLREKASATFPVWGFLLVYSASVVAFFVCSRFRAPILPALALLGGVGVVRLRAMALERAWGRVVPAALLAALGAAFTLWVPLDKVVDPEVAGHLELGRAALASEDLGRAEEHFSRVLRLAPGYTYVYKGLADVALRRNDDRQASFYAEQGLEILAAKRAAGKRGFGEPELVEVLVFALVRRKGPQVAAQTLELRLREDPGECASYDALVQLYEGAGITAAAERIRAAKAAAGCR